VSAHDPSRLAAGRARRSAFVEEVGEDGGQRHRHVVLDDTPPKW
jgi:hypothetical protein